MKKIIILCLTCAFIGRASAQESMQQVMEKRGKELVRVIGLTEKEDYRKFIKENYTEALINKQMRPNIQGPDGGAIKTDDKPSDNMDAKIKMYERIHNDIGKGKILSIKAEGEKLSLEVEGETGSHINFILTFQKDSPYLIDGFSVQMMMGR